MTPQEQFVNELFDRLTTLEAKPRDPDAGRLIADGLRRAPHAVYALVQTALVQDEALKRANARIEELQAQSAGEFNTRRILGQRARRDPRQALTDEARYHQWARRTAIQPCGCTMTKDTTRLLSAIPTATA